MAKRDKLLNFRIMTIDKDGNTACLYDSTLKEPCIDREGLDRLREKILERVSEKASELYSNDPNAFPESLFLGG